MLILTLALTGIYMSLGVALLLKSAETLRSKSLTSEERWFNILLVVALLIGCYLISNSTRIEL
jgi:hypothetical protein